MAWGAEEWQAWVDGRKAEASRVTAQGNAIDPRTPNERMQDSLNEVIADTFAVWLEGVEPIDITGV
jgi:hypothetical protein